MRVPHAPALLVTGGAGFIGSNYVHHVRSRGLNRVINLDKLTYAGNPANLESLHDDPEHIFVCGDIGNRDLVGRLLDEHRPKAIVHFAAESHVDRSIHGPADFIQTNVVGTFHLLEEARRYWNAGGRDDFRFLHVSTDEVYGSLKADDPPFTERAPYAPNSPYSASKAAADHLVRAYHKTYGLPTLLTNCSNNYGPFQFPEKLIPLMILNALAGEQLPVYGDGLNVRDWLYVEDHCEALQQVLERGRLGETYNIGGDCEMTNIDVVKSLCGVLDEIRSESPHCPHQSLITFIKDRPGHDRRYGIDCSKISNELGWSPRESFASGLAKTVRWYLQNEKWVATVRTGVYRDWIEKHYAQD